MLHICPPKIPWTSPEIGVGEGWDNLGSVPGGVTLEGLGDFKITLSPTPLVNNAGVGLVGPLEGLSLAAMQNVFDTNFFGAVRLVKAVLPGMKRRRQGHIVVVSSVMGLQGEPWGCTPGNPPSA